VTHHTMRKDVMNQVVMQIPAQTTGFVQVVENAIVALDMRDLQTATRARFVEPTFGDGSIITCYNAKPCQFVVYVAGGSNPEVGVQHVSDDLTTLVNVSTPVKVQYVPGIQNLLESVITIGAPPPRTYLGHQRVCLDVHESHNVEATTNVHVQHVIDRPSDCFTDISFTFSEKGSHAVCLNA
ncbi:hypothetical protein ACJMK2_021950, partial [Sinanodonta woodiana]